MHYYDDFGCLFLLIILGVLFRGRLGPGHGCGWLMFGWPFWFLYDDSYYGDSVFGSSYWAKKKRRKETRLPIVTTPKVVKADPGFHDERLEQLIEEGKLREAREYLHSMLKISKEVGDKQVKANYGKYENEINIAALRMDQVKRDRPEVLEKGPQLGIPIGFEQATREKQARERAEKKRVEREKTERERETEERVAGERAAHEKYLLDQAERERDAREDAERERAARQRAATEQAEREKTAIEKAAGERAAEEAIKREREKKKTDIAEDDVQMEFLD